MASGMIPPEIIEEIKVRTDIVPIVEQYVVLTKKSSKNYFGLCPFHSEDTASFSVSPGKQIYYCFGCHKGGDVFNFIMDIENLTYPQAIRHLADRAGVQIDQVMDPAYEKKRDHSRRIEDLYVEAARYFYHNLNSTAGKQARAYLNARSISERTAKTFGLGYADTKWNGLHKHLTSLGYRSNELNDSGLFRQSSRGDTIDLFHDRLIFPIISGSGKGKIVAFGGRVMDDSMPKYINSPETLIYTKGRHLYGLNLAKKSRDKRILLVEGYMDCISVYQGGIDNVCAVLGTALTEQQAKLLRQHTDHVILALDADRAGQAATIRAIDILEKTGLKLNVLQIPDGKDPDQYIREHGGERFKALMDDALPIYDYMLSAAWKLANEGQSLNVSLLQDEVCKVLELIDNNILFEVYITKAAAMLGIQVDAVRNELARRARGGQNAMDSARSYPPVQNQMSPHVPEDNYASHQNLQNIYLSRDEAYLLILLSSHSDVFETMKEKADESDFLAANTNEAGPGRAWLSNVFSLIRAGKMTPTGLLSESMGLALHNQPLADILAETIMKLPDQQSLTQLVEEAERYRKAVRIDRLTRDRTALLTKMNAPELEAEKKSHLRELYMNIERDLQQLRK